MTTQTVTNYKTFFENIVLNNIDLEAYDIIVDNDYDKVQEVYKIFLSEYGFKENIQRYGNEQNAFASWLQGLPTVLTVPFYYHKQLKLAYEAGIIKERKGKGKELVENRLTDSWFANCANAFFTLKDNL